MNEDINRFIKHTIVNLERALMKDDDKVTWAVLTNLSEVLDTYIEPLELSVLCATLGNQEKNGTA